MAAQCKHYLTHGSHSADQWGVFEASAHCLYSPGSAFGEDIKLNEEWAKNSPLWSLEINTAGLCELIVWITTPLQRPVHIQG